MTKKLSGTRARDSLLRPDDHLPMEFCRRFSISKSKLIEELQSGRLVAHHWPIDEMTVLAFIRWVDALKWAQDPATPVRMKKKFWPVATSLAMEARTNDDPFQMFFKRKDIERLFQEHSGKLGRQ